MTKNKTQKSFFKQFQWYIYALMIFLPGLKVLKNYVPMNSIFFDDLFEVMVVFVDIFVFILLVGQLRNSNKALEMTTKQMEEYREEREENKKQAIEDRKYRISEFKQNLILDKKLTTLEDIHKLLNDGFDLLSIYIQKEDLEKSNPIVKIHNSLMDYLGLKYLYMSSKLAIKLREYSDRLKQIGTDSNLKTRENIKLLIDEIEPLVLLIQKDFEDFQKG